MPSRSLTDRYLKTLTPSGSRTDHFDRHVTGLALRLAVSGRKTWCAFFRVHGRLRRMTLGHYPDVTLHQARVKARHVLAEVALHGTDPASARLESRHGATMAELAEAYLTHHAKPHKKSWPEDQRIITREVLPHWRHRLVADLARRDVLALIGAVADRAPVMANRVLALVRGMLNFAVAQEWITSNPAALVKKPSPEHTRDRVLTAAEIRTLWAALDDLSSTMRALFKTRLLTGQRGGEVVRMQWADVDLAQALWTIPGHETKNAQPHRVPLTTPVVALLRAQRATVPDGIPWVFSNALGSGSVHHRAKKVPAQLTRRLGFHFRGHDLRRTVATCMAERGVLVHVIARVLNHVDGSPRATKAYDRHTYDGEKRLALETWAQQLDQILSGTTITVDPFLTAGQEALPHGP